MGIFLSGIGCHPLWLTHTLVWPPSQNQVSGACPHSPQRVTCTIHLSSISKILPKYCRRSLISLLMMHVNMYLHTCMYYTVCMISSTMAYTRTLTLKICILQLSKLCNLIYIMYFNVLSSPANILCIIRLSKINSMFNITLKGRRIKLNTQYSLTNYVYSFAWTQI